MDNSMMMLLALSGGLGGSGTAFGGIESSKLMAQMFTSGTARELIKVQNYQTTGNIMYLMF